MPAPETTPVLRIGVVDDHAITRLSLTEFLDCQPQMKVVGQAKNGREAVELARKVPMEVMLLDLSMPGQSGFESISRIRAHAPHMAVLVLSGHAPEQYAVTMLKHGAAGYLNKQCDPADIVKAIRKIAAGQSVIDEAQRSLLVERQLATEHAPHLQLSHRHFQVFMRLAQGQKNETIARELSLGLKTVSTYRVVIMRTIQARNNSELTYYAVKHGLIA
ncbi:MAG: response regulator transcription factor [Haliea sp.]|nr:MAG: response regulator transcription factor [Haliea sp.]